MDNKKVKIEMTTTRHKRFLAFLEAEKVVKGIKKGMKELQKAKTGKIYLKSAFELADEL